MYDWVHMTNRVLYLALGSSRIRAATENVRNLASSGYRVVLVVADSPDWSSIVDELTQLSGVEAVRLRVDKSGSVWRAAKKLVGDRSGPFARVGLLIAGDAQALPVAWIASRRWPDVELRLEPHDPGRRIAAADVTVVTPWYPSPNNPYAGSFVRASTGAVAGASRQGRRISVIHTEDWSAKADPALTDAVMASIERFREHRDMVSVLDTNEGELARVPVPLIRRKNYASWVAAHEAALRMALPTGRIEAPVVHAYTGIYGGVLAIRLAAPDARIVVSEHASFLEKVFAQAPARALYGEVLSRAEAFLCVSVNVASQITREFPQYAHKLRVVPNIIDFDQFTPGPQRDPRLLRWLYVGRLTKAKGVEVVLEAFALVAQQEPEVSLTMVGHGNLEGRLRARASELGVADRFRLLPPVVPEDVNTLMCEHDLLVHASKQETFGMTVVEAVASGLPVLVSRSGGPEESLAGLESQAGALMDVSDDPQIIVNAYWKLRRNADDLDLLGARKALEERYGAGVVGKQLIAAYDDRELPAPLTAMASDSVQGATENCAAPPAKETLGRADPVGRAVVLALTPANPRRIVSFANHLVEQGAHVSLVTARATAEWERLALDPSIPVVSIEAAERRLLIPRGERFLVYRAPRAVLRAVRRVAARKCDVIGPELAVASVQRAHTRYANAFHRKIFNRGYTEVRPRLLAKLVRRHVEPKVDLKLTDHVFVTDINSTVIGWKWAKANPHLSVTTHMDRNTYAAK
jgi:glycogen(starch) synthase